MRRFTSFLSALLFVGSLHATAQTGNFIIAQHGKPVGTATVTFAASPMDTTPPPSSASPCRPQLLAFQDRESLLGQPSAPRPAQRHGEQLRRQPHSRARLSSVPAHVSANGRASTTRLALHPTRSSARLRPRRIRHPAGHCRRPKQSQPLGHPPKKSGVQNGSIVPVQLATYADEKGTSTASPSRFTIWSPPSPTPNPTSSPAPKTSFYRPNSPSRVLPWSAKASSSPHRPRPARRRLRRNQPSKPNPPHQPPCSNKSQDPPCPILSASFCGKGGKPRTQGPWNGSPYRWVPHP